MAEPQTPSAARISNKSLSLDPSAALEQVQGLLKAKDDTSKFVGLALLKSILDNQPSVRKDSARIIVLWNAISPKFLDRLLRAGQNQKVSNQEAKDMTDIAVSVLHTFAILLPESSRKEKKFTGRISALANALIYSSAETTTLLLQALFTLCSLPEGAFELLNCNDLSPMTEIATQQPLVLDIFSSALSSVATQPSNSAMVPLKLDALVSSLVVSFRGTDSVTLLSFIGSLFPKLPNECVSSSPSWLASLIKTLRALVISRPTPAGRSAYTEASAALLQAYPAQATPLLFQAPQNSNIDEKPFSYLFINLILIDIRSSFPSLLSKLNGIDYPAISRRLTAAFDIISSFVGFLVRSLTVDGENSKGNNFAMPPDLLLRLRKDLAETMSLTNEYLRDRWDASIAGVSGLHPEAREGTSVTSTGTRLTLTWDSMKDNVSEDSLVLASVRTLAIWLREDENENLRKESAGLMDMFTDLYQQSSESTMDFRLPLLMAFEGIMVNEDGVDAFVAQNGWETISADLLAIAKSPNSTTASRGIEIVRVLLAVIDSESTSEPREEWMLVVVAASSMKPTTSSNADIIEFQIAVLQLSVALLESAPPGMQKRHSTKTSGLMGLLNQLSKHIRKTLPPPISNEFEESLKDVAMSMENLR